MQRLPDEAIGVSYFGDDFSRTVRLRCFSRLCSYMLQLNAMVAEQNNPFPLIHIMYSQVELHTTGASIS